VDVAAVSHADLGLVVPAVVHADRADLVRGLPARALVDAAHEVDVIAVRAALGVDEVDVVLAEGRGVGRERGVEDPFRRRDDDGVLAEVARRDVERRPGHVQLGGAVFVRVEAVVDEATIDQALGDVDAGTPVAVTGGGVVEGRPEAPGGAAVLRAADREAVGVVVVVPLDDGVEIAVAGDGEIVVVHRRVRRDRDVVAAEVVRPLAAATFRRLGQPQVRLAQARVRCAQVQRVLLVRGQDAHARTAAGRGGHEIARECRQGEGDEAGRAHGAEGAERAERAERDRRGRAPGLRDGSQ